MDQKNSSIQLIVPVLVSMVSKTLSGTNPWLQFLSLSLSIPKDSNPLYTGGLFHCYMLDESICHIRDVGSILSLLYYFSWKSY